MKKQHKSKEEELQRTDGKYQRDKEKKKLDECHFLVRRQQKNRSVRTLAC